MHGLISNPVAHLDKLDPKPPKKLSREQKAIARRNAQFEAQRAQEDRMAGPMMQDLGKTTEHQTKMQVVQVPKRPPQQAGMTMPPPVQPMRQPTVQHIQRTPQEPVADTSAALLQELESDFGEPVAGEQAEPAPILAPSDDEDVDAILKRFKGSPEEVAKQVAKSYKSAEKRMRQLEHEKQLLMNQPQQSIPTQPAAPVVAHPQIQAVPQFNYKKAGETFLDDTATHLQELDQHIGTRIESELAQKYIAPIYNELVDNRLFRKYGDVVTEENLDVIKAMATREPGADPWQRLESAVAKYRAAAPVVKPLVNQEVQQMQAGAQLPSPQARRVSTKMYKASELDKIIRAPDYLLDPRKRTLVMKAYEEGRVLRDQ